MNFNNNPLSVFKLEMNYFTVRYTYSGSSSYYIISSKVALRVAKVDCHNCITASL